MTTPTKEQVEAALDRPMHGEYHLLLPKHISVLRTYIANLQAEVRHHEELDKKTLVETLDEEITRLKAELARKDDALADCLDELQELRIEHKYVHQWTERMKRNYAALAPAAQKVGV